MYAATLKRSTIAALIALAVMLAGAARADADGASTILYRCKHGESLAGFSQAAYRKALHTMSTLEAEYTECGELISRAQRVAAGSGHGGAGGGAGGGGSTGTGPPAGSAIAVTPTEQRAIENAHRFVAPAIRLGDQVINPGVVHANIASAFSSLPDPLLAVLAFLCASILAVGALSIRKRVRLPGSH